MNKLLFAMLFLMISIPQFAQIGYDPMLIQKDGLPVMVPSKAPTRYNQYRDYHIYAPKTETSTTFGNPVIGNQFLERNETRIPYDNSFYKNNPMLDTTRVFLFDENGNPIRDINRIYAFPPETEKTPQLDVEADAEPEPPQEGWEREENEILPAEDDELEEAIPVDDLEEDEE